MTAAQSAPALAEGLGGDESPATAVGDESPPLALHGWRAPLLSKLLALVLLATLAPLVISGALSIRRGMAAVGETAQRNLQLTAALTATRLDQLFLDTQRLQGVIATSHAVAEACAAPTPRRGAMLPWVGSQLERLLEANPDIALAYVADANGICWISTSPDMVGRDYKATREYMRRALAGEQYISELAVGITTREPGVFFAGPVRDPQGALVGAVVLKLKGEVIDRICGEVNGSIAQGFAGVLDAQQVIISHPDRQLLYHSLGTMSPQVTAGIDPKLQYAVDRIESAGLEDLAQALREGAPRGDLTFTGLDGVVNVAGFVRMALRPWTVMVVQPRIEFQRPLEALARSQLRASVVVGVLAVVAAVVVTWMLLRPVKALRQAALQAAAGDWSARARVVSRDELGDLARTFNEMMPRLQEGARMHDALRLAMEVQRRLLPSGSPSIPGLDVAGINRAADETGGDYYDFVDLSAWQDGTLAVAVGDVTGHGISAALLMATARALLRSRATPPGALAELMGDVNQRLCDDTPDGRFMTLMYALLDRPHRTLRLVSAGHDPVIVYIPAEDRFDEFAGEDLPLGIQQDWTFREVSFELPEDSVLLFGTDGVWETMNPAGEQFGKERLGEVIRRHGDGSAREILSAVLDALAGFRGPCPQRDDVTVVVVRVVPVARPVSAVGNGASSGGGGAAPGVPAPASLTPG